MTIAAAPAVTMNEQRMRAEPALHGAKPGIIGIDATAVCSASLIVDSIRFANFRPFSSNFDLDLVAIGPFKSAVSPESSDSGQ